MVRFMDSRKGGQAVLRRGFSIKNFGNSTALAAVLVQLAILALPGALNAQFTNGGWAYNRTVTVAPSGLSGSAETNFPVLVRLNGKIANGGNSSDSLVFANSLSTGYDIRFAQTGYTDSVPFEIERYDNANMYAEFWVLIPSVSVTASTTFKMYFGNAGVSGSPSAPSRVWTHANGFGLVYHMNYNAANASDVGPDGVTGTYTSGITMNTGTTATGAIGYGESFGGASGNDYTAVLSANGKPPAFQYLWTVSGWFYLNSSGNLGGGVFDKGADLTSTFHSGSNGFVFCNGTGFGAGTCPAYSNYYGNMRTTATVGTGGWHHVAWEYQGTGSSSTAPATQNIFIDGAAQTLSATAYVNKADGYADVWVGACNNHIASTSDYFNGSMDEFRIDTAYRSANWVALNYQTQMPPSVGAGIVSLSPFILGPGAPVLSSPTNNSINQPIVNLSLNWTSGSGAAVTSYEVQVTTAPDFSSTVYDFPGVTATSQALPTLSNYVTYYWRVDATGSGGTGPWSGVWTFATIAAFGAPPLATPTNNAINQPIPPTLTWAAVSGATSYWLQVSTESAFATPIYNSGDQGLTSISQSVPGLSNYTTYYWEVNAYNGADAGWSSVWTFTTVIATPSLSAPTNGAVNQPLTSLSLSWGAVTGAASYTLQVSSVAGSFASTVYSGSVAGTSQILPNTLNTNTTYYWQVNAVGGNGGAGAWAASWSFQTVPAIPAAPVLTSPSNNAINQSASPTLSWSSSSGYGQLSYTLWISTASNFSSTVAYSTSGTSQAIGPLTPPPYVYYWQVQATNISGTGPWSAVWSFSVTEDYTQWGQSTNLTVNTGSNGANVSSTVSNFPVLVRLNSTNFSGWGQTQPGGADIRFSAGGAPATQLSYQIQRWDGTDNLAEIWVLVPTVTASAATQLTMYWQMAGVISQSSGPRVFSPSNNFVGVWHLQDNTDATGNGYNLTNAGAVKVSGQIDSGYSFNGTSGEIMSVSGVMGSPATLTMSCWMSTSSTSQMDYISIANEATLESNVSGGNAVFYQNNQASGSAWPAINYAASSVLYGKGWSYVSAVINPSGSSPQESFYENGAVPAMGTTANNWGSNTYPISYNISPATTGLGYNPSNGSTYRYFNGSLNEVRIENTARSAAWVALDYANQQTNQTLVTMNSYQPVAPSLSSPASGATDQPYSSLTLNWNAVSGATSYGLMVSTSATFASAVTYLTGLTGTSQVLSSLAGSTTFYWQVFDVATGGTAGPGGTSAWAASWSFTTGVATGTPVLSSPANGAPNQAFSGLSLSWSSGSGGSVTSYTVQLSTASTFSTTVNSWSNPIAAPTTSVALPTLASSTTYYWEVLATGPNGSSAWATAWSFTTVPPAPGAPVLVSPENGFSSIPLSPNVAWGSVATATSYEVQVSSTDASFSSTILDVQGLTGTFAGIGPLAYNTLYYWRVNAINVGGGTMSVVRSFTSAEDYADLWSHHFQIPLNTTNSGTGAAYVASNQINFPVLVRLTTSNFSGWSQIASGGADLRFSSGANYKKAFPYQIDYWSASGPANDSAAIWVLVDTVYGNDNTRSIEMHYGNGGAASLSSGAAVFDTGNGYQAVYHFSETSAGNANDATVNSYTATNIAAPAVVPGVIGNARSFNGTTQGFWAANTESPPGKVCFPSQGVYTLSAWVLSSWTTGDQSTPGIISKGTAGAGQYQLYERGTAGTTSSYEYCFLEQRASGGAQSKRTPAGGIAASTAGQWVHIVSVRNGPNMVLYVNGVNAGTGSDSATSGGTRDTTENIGIGARLTTGSSPTDTNKWHGLIDEPEIASVARSADWVNLSYQNEQPSQALVALGTLPSIPALSAPANNSTNQFPSLILSWTTATGAATYEVQVATSSGFGSATVADQGLISGLTYAPPGLNGGTTYYWHVDATNSNGTQAWSAAWSFTTAQIPGVPLISSPSNASQNQAISGLTLSWSSNSGGPVTSYTVQLAITSTFSTTVNSWTNPLPAATTSEALPTLANATTYYWKVAATGPGGTAWASAWSFTTVIAAPVAPVLSSPTNGAANEPINLSLSWGSVSNAVSYHLNVATASDFSTTVFDLRGLTTTSQTITDLAYSTIYYWEVGAKDAGGVSAWSGASSFTTMPAAPAVPTLFLPTNNAVGQATTLNLSWSTSVNALSYGLQVAAVSDFSTTVFSGSGLTTTAQTVAGLQTLSTYYWKVDAASSGGTSAWSGAWSFTTISHFIVPYTVTGSSMTVLVKDSINPTLNGSVIQSGDEIAVFNHTGLCVGDAVWRDTNATITVWGQNSQSRTVDGMADSEVLRYRMWDAVHSTEMKAVATYLDSLQNPGARNDSFYVTNGISILGSLTGISAPVAPTLVSPTNTSGNISITPTFSWNSVNTATSYALNISAVSTFSTTVYFQGGLTGTSQMVSGLANVTTYYWKVGAKNAGGVSAWSSVWSFTTVIGAPGAPVLALPTNGATGEPVNPDLSWNSVAGAVSYHLDVSAGSDFTTTVFSQGGLTGTSQALSSLANSTAYIWRVGAKNINGVSAWSGVWTFTTIIAAPGVPQLASPSSGATNVPLPVVLSWNTSANAATYAVQVSTDAVFGSTVTAQIGLTGTMASISGLGNSATYYWRVGAKDAGGVSGWSGAWSFTTVIAAPGAPQLVLPTNGATGEPVSLSLSWNSVSAAVSYHLDVSAGSDFTTTVFSQGSLTGTSQTLNGLANSTAYIWRVGAKNAGGVSAWSSVWSFTTVIGAPGAPQLALPTNGATGEPVNLNLSWNSVAGAVSYHLDVSAGSDFTTTVFSQGGLTGTSQALSSLANSTVYIWRVGAKNISGVSAWSGVWTFTTIIATPGVPQLASPSSGATNVLLPVVLSWNTSTNAATYAVQVSTDAAFGSTVTAQIGLTGTMASISGLGNSMTYYWRVGAKDAGGVSGWSNAWSFTTIVAAPGVPVLASPSNGAGNQPVSLSLSWNTSANAATYAVQVSTDAAFGSTVTAQIGLTGTTASISGLGNSATYYWRVGAKDAGGVSGWSGGWSFTTIVAAPSAPALVSPSNGAGNQPISSLGLSWGSSALATSYEVEVSLSSGFGSTLFDQSGVLTNATVNGLVNSTTYYWRANASNVGGTSWSNAWSFTTIVAAPGVPVLASPSNGAGNQPVSLSLSWNTSANAATYAVQVSTDAAFGSTVTAQIGLTGTMASVSGLGNSATYYWRVGAKDAGGVSGWSGSWSFTTIVAAPGAPVLASPSNGAGNQPISSLGLSWGSSALATSYEVEVSLSSGFGSTLFDQSGVLTNATVNGLTNSTTYYWRANASNVGGTSWSNAWSFTTIVAAPGVPVLASPSNGAGNRPVSLSLSWNTSANAATYAVQVSTDAAFGSTVTAQIGLTGTMASVSGLGNSATYFWKVSAANAGGASAWSGIWSFTTLENFSLPVNAGWNMISLNIRPSDSTPEAVFGDTTTMRTEHYPKGFVLVKDLAGETYWPSMGINGLGTLHTGEGYQMYSDSTDTVRAVGSAINAYATPISLNKGWNLPAYLPQINLPIETTLSGIVSQIMMMKDNDGEIYFPDYGIDEIDTMVAGQSYFMYMKSVATLEYAGSPKEASSNAHRLLSLPTPRHYGKHANTGNNASVLATRVLFGNQAAPDSCEIGAFDGSGNLVGSGTVIHGLAAFPVWGTNTQTKRKDGLGASEKITFKLWNKTGEYPVTFQTNDGSAVSYAAQAVFLGSLSVPEGALIREFNLARVYPNPFRGFVRVAFDVPTINGVAEHDIEINIFNMKGIVVHQLARGKYAAGHYVVSWSGESSGTAMVGSSVYVIQMKAANFDKRLKLVRIQ